VKEIAKSSHAAGVRGNSR